MCFGADAAKSNRRKSPRSPIATGADGSVSNRTQRRVEWGFFVLLLVIGGLVVMSTGVTGLYIGRIFNEVRDRPLFVIGESTDHDAESLESATRETSGAEVR